ncbi:MAG: TRAP transporter large permease subunit [Synergistetes bacterium]|nr:TRAP transporter large permease subunit [Synergistota bacterium]MDW8193153.1 TRAP transporter large permease subunit [Synergistota bacterium]
MGDTGILAIMMFPLIALGVFLGFPVFAVLMGAALLLGFIGWGPQVMDQMVSCAFWVLMNDALPAVPLFVFMGSMMEKSRLADKAFKLMQIILGPIRGSLALATIVLCTLLAAGTGIVGASVTMMGLLALPVMLERKYDIPLATGTIIAGGTLGILIPPSIMLVLYGPLANLSVARLFTAAIMPGLLLSGLYIAYIFIRCLINPSLGPALPPEERKVPLKQLLALISLDLIPFLFTILAVLGSILFGLASPTEAAGVGCVASLALAAIHKQLNLKNILAAVKETAMTSSFILTITLGANIFTGVFLALGGGTVITNLLMSLPLGPYGILFVILAIIFILGFFIDWIAILLIFIPIVTPIVPKLGFNPLWFATVVCVCLQTSFLTPPFAYSIFYLKGIAPPQVKLNHIYKGVVPFVILQLIGTALCVKYPQIVLWLPKLMYGR